MSYDAGFTDEECDRIHNQRLRRESHKEFKTGGKKDLAGKPRFDLIPPEIDKALAEVYTLGAGKYEDRNWEKGIPFMTCVGALKRHFNAWLHKIDINDADGDLNHMKHVLWWAAALVTFIERDRNDLDDRS